ncbi:hypothetical protein FOZ62_012988, partial [Perkinsus olseni]
NDDTSSTTGNDYQHWFNTLFYPMVIDKAITRLLQYAAHAAPPSDGPTLRWITALVCGKGIYLTPRRRSRLQYTLSILQEEGGGAHHRHGYDIARGFGSSSKNSAAAAAIVDIKKVVSNRDDGIIVVLDGVRDIHNISGMYRLCDALGIYQLYILPSCNSDDDKMRIRKTADGVSRRSIRYLKVTRFNDHYHAINDLHSRGYQIWATDVSPQAVSYHDLLDTTNPTSRLPDRLAVVFGQESCGISDIIRDCADMRCYIPLYGVVESLN